MRLSVYLSFFLLLFAPNVAHAQYCNPASVGLILRDEKGAALTQADVKSVAERLPKQIGDAQTWLGEVSFAPDNKTFFWEDSTYFEKGRKVPALMFSNSSTCTMHLTEATLERQGLKMRLIFNIDISRETRDRRPVIEAPPFQNGAFQLDLKDWIHELDKPIPAAKWKRLKS